MAKIKIVGNSRAAHDVLHKHGIHHHGDLEIVDGMLLGGEMEEFEANVDPQVVKELLSKELPEAKVMVKCFLGWFRVQ